MILTHVTNVINAFCNWVSVLLTFILIITSIPSPPHSFIPGLNLPLLQILPTAAFLFFFRADSTDSPDCLPILLSFHVFPTFRQVVGSVQ